MHLDLRIPIGLLLSACGGVLLLDGLITGSLVLGINVNLWWGGVMVLSGAVALYLGRANVGDAAAWLKGLPRRSRSPLR